MSNPQTLNQQRTPKEIGDDETGNDNIDNVDPDLDVDDEEGDDDIEEEE